uniref:tetratricopeptide repeat protein n=1 Tax=Campylobacter taeniopygiae TaxID=2510188 RepID=UPI0038B3064D
MACGNLGILYTKGLGVERDYKKAHKFYYKACSGYNDIPDINKGDMAKFCYNLGIFYVFGKGGEYNLSEGGKCLNLACTLDRTYCDKTDMATTR